MIHFWLSSSRPQSLVCFAVGAGCRNRPQKNTESVKRRELVCFLVVFALFCGNSDLLQSPPEFWISLGLRISRSTSLYSLRSSLFRPPGSSGLVRGTEDHLKDCWPKTMRHVALKSRKGIYEHKTN